MLKDLIIFQKSYDLLKQLHVLVAKFPKSEKFVLAQRMENVALDLLEAVIEANESRDKASHLRKVSLALEKVRIWMRLAFDLKFIGIRHEGGTNSIRAGAQNVGTCCPDDKGEAQAEDPPEQEYRSGAQGRNNL